MTTSCRYAARLIPNGRQHPAGTGLGRRRDRAGDNAGFGPIPQVVTREQGISSASAGLRPSARRRPGRARRRRRGRQWPGRPARGQGRAGVQCGRPPASCWRSRGRPRHRATRPKLTFVQVSGGCGIRTHGDASTPQRFSRALTTVFRRSPASTLVSSLQVRCVLTSLRIPSDPPADLHECSTNVLLRAAARRPRQQAWKMHWHDPCSQFVIAGY